MNSHPTVFRDCAPWRNEEATIAAAVESLGGAALKLARFLLSTISLQMARRACLKKLSSRFGGIACFTNNGAACGLGREKNYAVSLGAAQASGDWLLFTDADGVHLPGSTGAGRLRMLRHPARGLFLIRPKQETRTWWERALIPFIYTRLAQKFSYDEVNDPASPAAAASGQYLMIRRSDYERIGGHGAVAGEVLEDVALGAHRETHAGVRLHFASGHGIMRVRMYRTFGAMWEGWTKNLYPLMCGTSPAVGRELRSVIPWIPNLLLLVTPAASNRRCARVGVAGRGATPRMPRNCGEIVFR